MKAERQHKEATSRVLQRSKGCGGNCRFIDNRPIINLMNMPNDTKSGTIQCLNIIQFGRHLGFEGIEDNVEEKAIKLNLKDGLQYAFEQNVPPVLINQIFTHISNTKLEELFGSSEITVWNEFIEAKKVLGTDFFDHWLPLVRENILKIIGFKMLLTGNVAGQDDLATTILEEFDPPPSFVGKDYLEIVTTLKELGYERMEAFQDAEPDKSPYGQDVWCNEGHMVVRIKIGGRSLAGRFPRPPHLVKEITKTPYLYGAKDIICKLTDENIKIPAGTKYSGRDMQTWYVEKSGRMLPPNAWQSPERCGDEDFRSLYARWAEGAHTAIGSTPSVPLVPLGEVRKYRLLYEQYNAKIEVGRMEKYGMYATLEDDDERFYLNEDEYLLWMDAKHKLGIE